MATLIDLKTFTDERGNLTVIEKVLPFDIKRIFYIYGVDYPVRGQHRHIKTIQAAICLQGCCTFNWDNNIENGIVDLNKPSVCLILQPQDWHTITNFSKDAILMVLASEQYDPLDYIYEPYTNVSN
jgi:dTDP-4-dehydrorhamnose 3,5-epimerase-like enzyme